jgi:hypothetical protein
LRPTPGEPTAHAMTKVERATKRVEKTFQTMFLTELKAEVDAMEEIVMAKRKQVVKEQIEKDFEGWFSNSGFSSSRDTKTFKATDQCWLIEALIAQVLQEHGAQHKELLDMFMLFEAKFEVVCRLVFGIKIEVANGHASDKDCTHNSKGPLQIQSSLIRRLNRTLARLPLIFKHPSL